MAKGKTPKAASLAPPRDDAARIASLERKSPNLAGSFSRRATVCQPAPGAYAQTERTVTELMSSSSWRLTAPVRAANKSSATRATRWVTSRISLRGRTSNYNPLAYDPLCPDGRRELPTPEKLETLQKLFDENITSEQNPEVELAGFEPFRHFMEVGRFKGLKATRETDADIEALRRAVQRRILRSHQPGGRFGKAEALQSLYRVRTLGRPGRLAAAKIAGSIPCRMGQRLSALDRAARCQRGKSEGSWRTGSATLRREASDLRRHAGLQHAGGSAARSYRKRDRADLSALGTVHRRRRLAPSRSPRAILEEYATASAHQAVFRASNGHISEATNSAFALATGEWVALLDHDDLLAFGYAGRRWRWRSPRTRRRS